MKLKDNQVLKLINDKFDLIKLLYKYNPSGKYYQGQSCYCPFHDNTNTPSAAIYDDDNHQTLYCFMEQKLYTAFDVMKTLLKQDVYAIASYIWEQMPEVEKQSWLSENGYTDFAKAFSEPEREVTADNKIIANASEAFKRRKIKLSEFIEIYKNANS